MPRVQRAFEQRGCNHDHKGAFETFTLELHAILTLHINRVHRPPPTQKKMTPQKKIKIKLQAVLEAEDSYFGEHAGPPETT